MDTPEHLKHTSGAMVNRRPLIVGARPISKQRRIQIARRTAGTKMAKRFAKQLGRPL